MALKWSVHTEDKALIKACLCHDRVAQGCFYQKYFPDAYRACNRYLSQYADVMSVVNAGFLKVFQHLHHYDPALGSAGAWIHRIMVRTAIDHIRQENRRFASDPLPEGGEETFSIESAVLTEMDAEALLAMVKKLPPMTRTVFNMAAIEGYSHREIAGELGVTESTSRWHLSEAKKRLQQLFRDSVKMISA